VAKRPANTFSIDWSKLLPEEFSEFPMVAWHASNPF
jgi:hypothetical protein